MNVSSALGSLTINADPAAHSDLLPAWAPLLAYNSSKAALNMLTLVYAPLPQINVVSVDPGFTATDLKVWTVSEDARSVFLLRRQCSRIDGQGRSCCSMA